MRATAQVRGYNDPHSCVYEFTEARGAETRNRSRECSGGIAAGVCIASGGGQARPGTWVDQ